LLAGYNLEVFFIISAATKLLTGKKLIAIFSRNIAAPVLTLKSSAEGLPAIKNYCRKQLKGRN
jgi:hypothetical protein